jgi:hypothetical protein
MAAKASVPVEAFPVNDRFRGHGPLLQGGGCATAGRKEPRFL